MQTKSEWEVAPSNAGASEAVRASSVGAKASAISRNERGMGRFKAIPLRVWLMILIATICGFGLVGSTVAVSTIMRDVIYSRVDDELKSSLGGWVNEDAIFQLRFNVPSEYFVLKKPENGKALVFNGSAGIPDISGIAANGKPVTVKSDSRSESNASWRAVAVEERGVVTVVAKDLNHEQTILQRLAFVQICINVIILVLICVCASFLVHRALRPLREVESTARRIAAGDLDRRVPQWPVNTEVGQLAFALNTMLARLQESIEQAREKEEQMRRFVGDASHELRTPLTSVRGYSELYRSGAMNDADRVLSKIDEESQRMSGLVEDLLVLTRAEGRALEMERLDLLDLCCKVVSSARAAFADRSIEVINETGDVPMVNGDPDRLYQVFLNLITNGLRHGGESAKVTVRLRYSGDGDWAVVRVEDNGRGMSADDVGHIFERFYRADTSRSRASGGTGLGLSIVKSLVEKHGGSVVAESVEGEGSVFSVRIPRSI